MIMQAAFTNDVVTNSVPLAVQSQQNLVDSIVKWINDLLCV